MPIIKLHRGSANTMSTSPKKNIILENGELFIEIPDNEVTEDNQYKFKVGDGSTTYENLPYAIDPTNISSSEESEEISVDYITKEDITLSNNSTTTVTFTDDSIKSNSIVELVSNTNNLEYTSVSITNGTCSFVFPTQSSSITVNFRLYVYTNYYKNTLMPNNLGNATISDVLSGYTFSSANGIGLTGTATAFKLFYRDMNETVTCDLSGSHTVSNYQCDVVYTGPVTYGDTTSGYQMCLLGNSSVASGVYWDTACSYIWTATFATGQVSDNEVTITNVKIPTREQILLYCNGREYRSGRFGNNYHTSTERTGSTAYYVGSDGVVTSGTKSSYNAVPYIVIPL